MMSDTDALACLTVPLVNLLDIDKPEGVFAAKLLPPTTLTKEVDVATTSELQDFVISRDLNTDLMDEVTDEEVEGMPPIRQLFTISVLINNSHEIVALVDCGSGVDCVSRRFIETFSVPGKEIASIKATSAFGQKSNDVSQRAYLKLQIGSRKWKRNFFVMDNLQYDMILGLPFVLKYADELDFLLCCVKGVSLVTEGEVGPQAEKFRHKDMLLVNAIKIGRDVRSQSAEVFALIIKPQDDSATVASDHPMVRSILADYADVIRDDLPPGLPPARSLTHTIDIIPGSTPPHRLPYRLTYDEIEELEKQIDELLAKEYIVPSASPYGAPILFVKKKDGSRRLCVDYRALNNITIKERFPLPLINELLESFKGSTVFSKLDLHSGYHQVRIAPRNVVKTAFVTRRGQFAWRVMPFGLTNAPSTFQKMMNTILQPFLDRFVIVYLDDILIYLRTDSGHNDHVRQILEVLREHQLVAKKKKCEFFLREVAFLGHIVTSQGVKPDPEKVRAIKEWPPIQSVKQAQSFIGLANYYRRFIPHFSTHAASIHDYITGKYPWGEDQQRSFDKLRNVLTLAPIMICPSPENRFVVQTDASGTCTGAVLSQVDDRNVLLGVVAYDSSKFHGAELNYDTRDKEFVAIIRALKKWRHYLLGRPFTLRTDHVSLKYMMSQRDAIPRINRNLDFLAEFDFTGEHVAGSSNTVADALSRVSVQAIELTSTPGEGYRDLFEFHYNRDPTFSEYYELFKSKSPIPVKHQTAIKSTHFEMTSFTMGYILG